MKKQLKKSLSLLLAVVLLLASAPLASLSDIDLSGLTDWLSPTAQAAFDPSTLKIPGYNDYDNVRYYVNKDNTASFVKVLKPSEVSGTYKIHSFGPFRITYINSGAFSNCTNVTWVTIPDTVQGIGYSAFNDTAYYQNADNWNEDGVLYNGTYLLGAKDSVSGTYKVVDGTTCIAGNAFANCTKLTGITLPESLKYISQQAFWKSGLKSVTLPDSLQRVSDKAFADCKNLSDVTFGSGLKRIGDYMFENCPSLTSVKIPDNIESIGQYAFSACSYLETVEIGSGFSALGNNVFNACRRLRNLTVSPENKTFHSENNCLINTAEKTLVVGCAVGMIPEDGSVTKIGYHAFSGRSRSSIAVPDSVTEIDSYAFSDCTGTAVVSLSKNLETIKISAFENCSYLVIMDFPKSLKAIYERAFKGCTELTKIVIPTTVKSVYDEAFLNCTSLKSVTIGAGVSTIGAKAFGYYNNGDSKIDGFTIYGTPGTAAETYAKENGFNFVTHIHKYKDTIIKKATCTETGEKAMVCECGETTTSIIPKTSHTPSDWIIDTPATCLESGKRHKECTVCGTTLSSEAIPATGHTSSEWIVDVPATCTEEGSRHKECTACGVTLESEVIPATGHNFEKKTTQATCTSIGFEASTCKNCGETHLTKTLPATGHKFTTTTIEPTCTSVGYETEVCEVCGESRFVKAIPATSHTESEWITDKTASCTENGSRHTECTVCKTVLKTEVLPTAGHFFEKKTTAATCTSIGFETEVCKNCNEVRFIKSLPATGHTASEWIVDSEASCKSAGSRHKECTVCKAVIEKETIPATEHKFTVSTVEPTCVSLGYETKTCENCGECQFVRSIPAKGHDWKVTEGKEATCTEVGFATGRVCKVCGAVDAESGEIEPLGHNIVVDTEAKEATCTETGLTESTHCTRCDYKTEAEVIPARGHNIVVDVDAAAATCTEAGTTEGSHCTRCDYKVKAERIAPLGHSDSNSDGKCDRCGVSLSSSKKCSCSCHKTGIANFFFKIGLFFQRIFGANKTCKCGVKHY